MNDLISRQAAIDSFWELDVEIRPSAINAIIDMIRTLPPAETPKRTGKSAQNVPNDDLIIRKTAIKAVDATWWNARGIRKTIQELPSAAVVHHKNILEIINQQPTADVVEVVRCKDCRFYTFKPQQTSRTTSVRRCNRSAIVCTKPDDYCSFGERVD